MDAFETHLPEEIVPDPPHNSFNPRREEYAISPLHAAAAAGQVETVRAILGIDKKFCRLKGKDGNTPVHLATMRGKIDVIREIVSSCVDCIEDETVQGQTALHLAVLHQETGAVIAIVDFITEKNRIDILYKKDEQGNTALHLATWRKNRQVR